MRSAVKNGDHVADIGVLDIEGKVINAGPCQSLVRWCNHHVKVNKQFFVTETVIGNDCLVVWGSAVHQAMLYNHPDRIWNKGHSLALPLAAVKGLDTNGTDTKGVNHGQPAEPPMLRTAPIDLMSLFGGIDDY